MVSVLNILVEGNGYLARDNPDAADGYHGRTRGWIGIMPLGFSRFRNGFINRSTLLSDGDARTQIAKGSA